MTNREKKDYLSRYLAAGREVARIEEELARWRSRAESTTAGIAMAPKGGVGGDRLQRAVAEMDALTARLGEEQIRLVGLRKDIDRAIRRVGDARLRYLLRLRYIEGLAWEKIADRLGVDLRWVYRLHGYALENLTIVRHY